MACFIFSIIFAISPAFLWRLYGHFALASHWVIIAALYLYFSIEDNFIKLKWNLLLITTALIHAYFIPMVFLIYMASFFKLPNFRWLSIIKQGSESLIILFVVCYLAGYFTVTSGVSRTEFGYGMLPLNLLAFIDSSGLWSYIIPNLNNGLDVGSNYLGLGVLIALFVSIIATLFFKRLQLCFGREFVPIILVTLLLVFYAITNNVVIGNKTFYLFKLPDFLYNLFSIFRASDRFFWVAYYLVFVSLFKFYSDNLSEKGVCVFFAFIVAIQFLDISKAIFFSIKNTHQM